MELIDGGVYYAGEDILYARVMEHRDERLARLFRLAKYETADMARGWLDSYPQAETVLCLIEVLANDSTEQEVWDEMPFLTLGALTKVEWDAMMQAFREGRGEFLADLLPDWTKAKETFHVNPVAVER